jgi:hypothetical protein
MSSALTRISDVNDMTAGIDDFHNRASRHSVKTARLVNLAEKNNYWCQNYAVDCFPDFLRNLEKDFNVEAMLICVQERFISTLDDFFLCGFQET